MTTNLSIDQQTENLKIDLDHHSHPHHLPRPRRNITIMTESTYLIIFVGNPLLDIQVMNGEELLKKYDLKVDDSILAEEKHLAMYASEPKVSLLWKPKLYFKLR